MLKSCKVTPPSGKVKKTFGCPNVLKGDDQILRDSLKDEARRMYSVQPQVNPQKVTKAYLDNYDGIFRKEKTI